MRHSSKRKQWTFTNYK